MLLPAQRATLWWLSFLSEEILNKKLTETKKFTAPVFHLPDGDCLGIQEKITALLSPQKRKSKSESLQLLFQQHIVGLP